MQIFILDYNIQENVQMYCDKHVNKLLTECCQILCTVYRFTLNKYSPNFLYKSTHKNHPLVKWTGLSVSNFCYVLDTAEALYNEYQYRYNKPDKHLRNWQIIDYFKKVLPALPCLSLLPFVQAIPEQYKQKDTVQAYRAYYNAEKLHFAKWTNRAIPFWVDKSKFAK